MATVDFSHLTAQERLDLIGDLWESLDAADLPLTAEWKAELDRRNARFDEERGHATSWGDLRAKLRRA